MIIRRITLYPSPIRLKEPFIISLGKLDYAENLIVAIECDDGNIGYGECSPFLTIHGENIQTCLEMGKILASQLLNQNPIDLATIHALLQKVMYGNTAIKSAFEMACYDLAAKSINQPLYRYLGFNRSQLHPLQTDYTISFSNIDKMAADAQWIINQGFQIVKVKLGGDINDDYERIKQIRSVIGMDIPLRLDANQGWTKDDAIQLLQRLEPFNILQCEEPISRKHFMELPEIRRQSPIPIMADESCYDEIDAQRLIALAACDRINIKLSKSSGLFSAIQILTLAEKHSIPLQFGGFLESRLGFTAIAHLAQCCKENPMIDFDTPLMFSEDPIEGGIQYLANGFIEMPETPGIGAAPKESYLKSIKSYIIE